MLCRGCLCFCLHGTYTRESSMYIHFLLHTDKCFSFLNICSMCMTTVTMVIYLHPPLLFIFQLCLAFLFLYLNSTFLMSTRIIAKASKYLHPQRSCLRMLHVFFLFDQAILFIFPQQILRN